MNKTWKRKWIKALRSGEYDQGKGALSVIEKDGSHHFYCLGVLCDIVPDSLCDWSPNGVPLPSGRNGMQTNTGEKGILPWRVKRELDIPLEGERDLMKMNDEGASFADIANWIEENL